MKFDREEILKHTRDKVLKWLSWKFNGAIFIDAGTSKGGSAISLSRNPTNLVITYDIIARPGMLNNIASIPNICFKELDINLLVPENFIKIDLIYLDISHNGTDEQAFLDKLEPYFKGILVMDDVDCPRRWPILHKVFNDITREKYLLDREIGENRGTGVVVYG